MKTFATYSFVAVLLAGTTLLNAQEPPEMPKPQAEHEWLQQVVGEWETKGEATMGPGQPPITCEGTETIRGIGGLWILSESQNTMMAVPVTGVMTLGYDPEKEKFVGTWVDSVTSHMWKYEGTLDETGKVLTLMTEGPNPMLPGETSKYKEVLEIKDRNHKVFSSSVQGPDGEWFTFVTIHATRKK